MVAARGAARRWAAAALLAAACLAAASLPVRTAAAFTASTTAGGSSFASAVLVAPSGFDVALTCSLGTWTAQLTWVPSPSTWAHGYRLEHWRGGTLQRAWSVTPVTATSTTDGGGALLGGQTYTYRIATTAGTWRSPTVSATATVPLVCL